MAQIHHNTGTTANDGTGDALRKFAQDVESNETELYNGKVDKDGAKVLSDNNFSDAYKDAIDNLVVVPQVQSDVAVTDPSDKAFIKNFPNLSVYATDAKLTSAIDAVIGGADTTADTLFKLNQKVEGLTAEEIDYSNGSLTNVKEALDQLLYVFPDITNFTISPSVVEIGTTVSSATLNWNLNKALTTLSIDNGVGSITPSLLSKALTGLSLVTNTTYTITGGDGANTDTASTTLNFRSKRWWGTSALATLTSADILTLQNSELATNRQQTRTINGGGNYIWFAFPTSFGLPTFVVNGLPSTAFTTSTVNHTNASGNTQDYYVIRTTTVQNGTLTIQLL